MGTSSTSVVNIEPAHVVRLDRLRVGYNRRPILPELSARIRPREIWALVGRNGGGKSSLIRTMLGLQPAISGSVERSETLSIAYVPQRSEQDPAVPARVLDLVRAGAERGWSFIRPFYLRRHKEAVRDALAVTQMTALMHRPFSALSEGQKQRAFIARALVAKPNLIVLDEPTSAMDPMSERSVFELIGSLATSLEVAVVVASHQMSFVPDFATHVIFVDSDDGVALAGPREAIVATPSFQRHYGFVVGTGDVASRENAGTSGTTSQLGSAL